MPRRIEAKAELSVARGCGFGGVAIVTMMIGMITQPALSLLLGGISALLTCFILLLKANFAHIVSYKRTEVWLMLDKTERPQAEVAQQVIGTVLKDVYLRFALYAANLALALILASIVFRLMPLNATL